MVTLNYFFIKYKMKKTLLSSKLITLLLVGSILLASCTSTTMIQSTPSGAKIYVDGQSVGSTPYSHSDMKILGSTTTVKLEKEGYETLITSFSKDEQVDVGAIIGGLFFWVPFLWTLKYDAIHNYDLKPSNNTEQLIINEQPKQIQLKSKVDRLRELKQLLDEKVLTDEEYENEKMKILAE
jgi:hypothetical protein